MSDLVGNPEARLSHVAAHVSTASAYTEKYTARYGHHSEKLAMSTIHLITRTKSCAGNTCILYFLSKIKINTN